MKGGFVWRCARGCAKVKSFHHGDTAARRKRLKIKSVKEKHKTGIETKQRLKDACLTHYPSDAVLHDWYVKIQQKTGFDI
jgi:hypothetical protein